MKALTPNDLMQRDYLQAQQIGVGENLDVTGGKACRVFAMEVYSRNKATAPTVGCGDCALYNATTAAGDYIGLINANGYSLCKTFGFAGVRFDALSLKIFGPNGDPESRLVALYLLDE